MEKAIKPYEEVKEILGEMTVPGPIMMANGLDLM